MKRSSLRAVGAILGLLCGLPLIAFVVLDVAEFQSRRGEINAILQGEAGEDRHPPVQVVQMLKASERYGPSVYASRLLARELQVIPQRQTMLEWHVRSALWWSFVRLHLSEEEQVAVVLGLAPTGAKLKGFTAASVALYRRQPSQLSISEIATILALVRQPSAEGTQLESLREMLLARYESGA